MKKVSLTISIILSIMVCFGQQPTLQEAFKQIKVLQVQLSSLKVSLSAQKAQVSDLETIVETQKKELERKINAESLKSLPVGSIVAYALDSKNIPSGWVPCDGRTITDANSIYNSYRVPDLRSVFVRGKGNTESLLAEGGTNFHSHSIPSHKHEVGSHTHIFTTGYSSIAAAGSCPNGIACSSTPGSIQYLIYSDSQSGFKQLTSHYHTGITGNASSGYTAEGGSGTTGSESNIPKYIALNYIIKIK